MDDLKIHSAGCPITRTGRCTCTYMAQWTGPGPAYPIFPLGHKGACLEEGGPRECSCHLTYDLVCYHRTSGWHRTDQVSCEAWDALVHHTRQYKDEEYIQNGFGHSDTTHPVYLLDVVEPQDQLEERTHTLMNGATYTVATPKHSRYGYTESYVKDLREVLANARAEAKDLRTRFWLMTGVAVAGWALSVARGIWGF